MNETLPAPDHSPATGSHGGHRCGNCESVLTGAFCATCGQHAHASARTLSAVVHDGWHDLTHLDGRLWCSLWFLLARPGQLTVDYFAERRARYLPPVRLYLCVSLLFFSFSLATHDHEYPRTHPAAGASHRANADAEASDDEDDDTPRLSCDDIKVEGSEALQRSAQAACERGRRKNGTEFWRSVAHNIPKMMFVFLPLVAVALKLLYWRPRRFYVEHLVYLLHNHSALFLCFSLFVLIERWPVLASAEMGHPHRRHADVCIYRVVSVRVDASVLRTEPLVDLPEIPDGLVRLRRVSVVYVEGLAALAALESS